MGSLISSSRANATNKPLDIPWIPTSTLQIAALYKAMTKKQESKEVQWSSSVVRLNAARIKSLNLDPKKSHPLIGLINQDCKQFIARLALKRQGSKERNTIDSSLHIQFCNDILNAYYQRIVNEKNLTGFAKRIEVRKLQRCMQDLFNWYSIQ